MKQFSVTVNAELGRWLEVFSYRVHTKDEEAAKRTGIMNAKAHMVSKAQGYNTTPEQWTYTATVK